MADSPLIHIDDDWKKQAQEEKRKLAEQEQQRAAKAPAAPPPTSASAGGAASAAAASARGRGREIPPANFAAIVQSLWTQAMLYLGELAPSGAEPMVNLDMARHQFDLLGILEAKTKGNLDAEEQRLLDAALYETSSRFINVASQYI
ncbi:MAG TPA: DUF1844 domain-containing protein [Humisphaera sp.]|jgi:hypothetical protein|nr:DUF1844 domain-containing protein [Humisphaera sp.]